MACSECLPTRLNSLAERTCFSQVLSPAQRKSAALDIELDIAAPSGGRGSGAPSVGDTTSKEAVRLQVRSDSSSG